MTGKEMQSEGVRKSDVESVRRELESAISSAVNRLKQVETVAQQRLRESTIEHQRLEAFIDELHYRLEFLTSSNEPPVTITGPLSENQILAMQAQEETLYERWVELQAMNVELEQLSNRLAWLIHQIEGACSWVLSPNDAEEQQSNDLQPTAGNQVMWAQIIMGQEAERARLAREIHDGPAQALANTVMRLQLVEQMFENRPEDARGEMERMRGALHESLQDVRRFIFNLRPASLTDAGLLPTLRQHVGDYSQQYGVSVELNLPENLVLSANQELVVFRVIQEALQNVHKHSEATRIEVNLQQRPGGPLTLNISDNGRGFDPKLVRQSRTSSSGLVSMRERAATVGGTLKVDSKVGTGTTITLTLPMSR